MRKRNEGAKAATFPNRDNGLKLYDCSTAPSPRRARIFIAEKGLDVEHVPVDLASGEHLTPEFQAINPACTVPVLELDDGTRIAENLGIACYLEAAFPKPPLLGVSPLEKGQVAAWNARVEFDGVLAISEAFRNKARGLQERSVTGSKSYPQVPELAERGRSRTEDFFAMLDDRLAEREFIATDDFSLADITALVAVDFARWINVEIEPRQQNLARWHREVTARPSARA